MRAHFIVVVLKFSCVFFQFTSSKNGIFIVSIAHSVFIELQISPRQVFIMTVIVVKLYAVTQNLCFGSGFFLAAQHFDSTKWSKINK